MCVYNTHIIIINSIITNNHSACIENWHFKNMWHIIHLKNVWPNIILKSGHNNMHHNNTLKNWCFIIIQFLEIWDCLHACTDLNGSGDLHVLVRRIRVGGFGHCDRFCSCWLKSSLVDHEAGSHREVTSTSCEPPPGVLIYHSPLSSSGSLWSSFP